jgi:hypothetical protein
VGYAHAHEFTSIVCQKQNAGSYVLSQVHLLGFKLLIVMNPLLETSSKTATEVMKEAFYLAKNTCFAKLPNKNMVSESH